MGKLAARRLKEEKEERCVVGTDATGLFVFSQLAPDLLEGANAVHESNGMVNHFFLLKNPSGPSPFPSSRSQKKIFF